MEFVNKEYAVPAGFDFFQNLLESFFKFTAVFGSGDHAGHIQGYDALVLQCLRDIARGNAMGQPFHNGGLAHARFTNKRGVILGAAAEDLNDPPDFLLTANHRVEFTGARGGGQVNTELVEKRGTIARRAGRFRPGRRLAQGADYLRPCLLQCNAKTFQHTRRHPLSLVQQTQQQVLGTNIVVTEAACLVNSQLNHPLGSGC